jgi:glycosyltransferase involved in cell wall biosynthesis
MRNRRKMLLIGVWANRNWILGNWIREVQLRSKEDFQVWWVPSVFAGKKRIEKLLALPLPTAESYFFSYITIFEKYLSINPRKFENRSIVLFPHAEAEIGPVKKQVETLNRAFAVYFFCSQDAKNLVASGLAAEKVRLAYCAVDVNCVESPEFERVEKTIVLASKFGWRKGLSILPEIIKLMPDWSFVALGRGWDTFIEETGIGLLPNFSHYEFNKSSRTRFFSECKIFLSLSELEGGPVPLIEAMAAGAIPVATKTGFAPDFVRDGVDGYLLETNPTPQEVVSAILRAELIQNNPKNSKINLLTWDRITSMTIMDKLNILENTRN